MSTRDNRGANYLLAAFCVVSLGLLSLPLTGKVHAFRACVAYVLNPVPFYGDRAAERLSGLPASAARIITQDVEVLRLRDENRQASLLKEELGSLRIENARLRKALGMKPAAGRVVRWARIIERDPLHWHRSVMLDAGEADGVLLGSPVVGLRGEVLGVVGRVTEVWKRTSMVLLLTDELSAVAAHLREPGLEGLVQGQGGGKLRMDYLPSQADIQVGQAVYTSHTSATFPAGLPIGEVTRVLARDPFLALKSAEVTPAVSGSELREVMILIPKRAEDQGSGLHFDTSTPQKDPQKGPKEGSGLHLHTSTPAEAQPKPQAGTAQP